MMTRDVSAHTHTATTGESQLLPEMGGTRHVTGTHTRGEWGKRGEGTARQGPAAREGKRRVPDHANSGGKAASLHREGRTSKSYPCRVSDNPKHKPKPKTNKVSVIKVKKVKISDSIDHSMYNSLQYGKLRVLDS